VFASAAPASVRPPAPLQPSTSGSFCAALVLTSGISGTSQIEEEATSLAHGCKAASTVYSKISWADDSCIAKGSKQCVIRFKG
jgi:hypothetical protein